jgi:hypothetical protein
MDISQEKKDFKALPKLSIWQKEQAPESVMISGINP